MLRKMLIITKAVTTAAIIGKVPIKGALAVCNVVCNPCPASLAADAISSEATQVINPAIIRPSLPGGVFFPPSAVLASSIFFSIRSGVNLLKMRIAFWTSEKLTPSGSFIPSAINWLIFFPSTSIVGISSI